RASRAPGQAGPSSLQRPHAGRPRARRFNGPPQPGFAAYDYAAAGRVPLLEQFRGAGSPTRQTVLLYSYDNGNRLTNETYTNGPWAVSTTTSYSYDNSGQLTGAGSATYGYDGAGTRNTGGFTPRAHNRLASRGTCTYTSDNQRT